MLLATFILLAGCSSAQVPAPPVSHELGQIVFAEDTYGGFYSYIPATVSPDTELVVLIHGTPAKEESAEDTAHFYIVNWLEFAEKHDLILIAPALNQEDFSSREGDHAFGGYRGLFGREIMADEWLLRLVRAYQEAFDLSKKRFYLYGHSAGGQFTARFLVTHPEHVKQAVISSAATYPQPTLEITWPFGMGEFDTDIEWDENTTNHVKIVPDKQKWLDATQIHLTVIVGLNDTSELPAYPGQKGKNRFTIARNWVQDMKSFAEENGLESRIKFEIIPGKGHSMSKLIPYCQEALFIEQNR
jgi:poly(3-hydroxybutyrate) depolymerase